MWEDQDQLKRCMTEALPDGTRPFLDRIDQAITTSVGSCSRARILPPAIRMWRITFRFFLGISAAALLINAIAVYGLHDVDADRVGKLNLAYWELTLELLVFGLILAVIFFLVTWIGTLVFHLRGISPNPALGVVLGIAVTILQYLAEFAVRKLAGHSVEAFLLSYLLLSPVGCAAIVLLNSHKRKRSEVTSAASLDHQPAS